MKQNEGKDRLLHALGYTSAFYSERGEKLLEGSEQRTDMVRPTADSVILVKFTVET